MKVVTSKCGHNQWVVNNKGNRVTPKYSLVTLSEYGPFYLAFCHDRFGVSNKKTDEIYVFLKDIEEEINIGKVVSCRQITDEIYAFNDGKEWSFYDSNVNLLKKGATTLYKCSNQPYIIVTLDNQKYYLDYNMQIVAGPFLSARDIDSLNHAIVVGLDKKSFVLSVIDGKFVPMAWSVECAISSTFSNGFFEIKQNGCYGVIDSNGKEILPPIYKRIIAKPYHFVIQMEEKYGLADITGKIIFDCLYDEIIETPDKFVAKEVIILETSKILDPNK